MSQTWPTTRLNRAGIPADKKIMRTRRWGAALCGSLFLVACEGRNGDAGPDFTQFTARDTGYTIEYLSPPWELSESDATDLELQIKTEILGSTIEGAPPTHTFRVGPASTDDTMIDLMGSVFSGNLEDVLPDLLPDTDGVGSTGFAATDAEIPQGTESEGEFGSTGVLDDVLDDAHYLEHVDITDPMAVARAELDHLVEEYDAEIISDIARFEGGEAPFVWLARIQGVFYVRAFYFKTSGNALRASYTSIFSLESYEIEYMISSLHISASEASP